MWKKIILLITLAIVIAVGMGSSQSVFASKLGDVFEQAEIPTYFIGGYQTSRDAFRTMCYLKTGTFYDCWGNGSLEDYTLLFEKVLQPTALRLIRLQTNSEAPTWLSNFVKASDLFNSGNLIALPCWGYGGVRDIFGINVIQQYPELMAYDIIANPKDYAIPDLRLLPIYQTQLKSVIDSYGNPKSIVGISSCPLSDGPIYDGKFDQKASGYNYQSLENFVNSRYFTTVNPVDGEITAPLAPPTWPFAPGLRDLSGNPSGTFTLTILVKDNSEKPVPQAFVIPNNPYYMSFYRTDNSGLINYTAGGIQSFYVIADLGSQNFYYGTTTVNVDSNQSIEIVLDQPYGKSKLWEQFIEKSKTYPLTDLARETFIFNPQYHSTYLPVANAQLEKAIFDYVRSYTGKNLLSRHAYRDRTILSEIQGYADLPQYSIGEMFDRTLNFGDENIAWGNLYDTGETGGIFGGKGLSLATDEEKYRYYLSAIPLLSNNQHTELSYLGFNLASTTIASQSYQFGEIMNRMKYLGGWSGYENPIINVLIISPLSGSYLLYTPFAKITLTPGAAGGYDPDLAKVNLTEYDVILFTGTDPLLSPTGMEKLKQFVREGKGVVFAAYLVWEGWKDAWNELLGVDFDRDAQGGNYGTLTVSNPNHPMLRPYGANVLPGYWPGDSIARPKTVLPNSNVSSIINSSLKGPVIFENNYGVGKVVVLPTYAATQGNSSFPYTIPASSYQTLVINSLLYVAKQESQIPIIWYPNYKAQQDWASSNVFYSITGKPNGPKLFWLSNPSTTVAPFEINLNASALGLSNNWLILDANSMQIVNKGNSPTININVTVPAQTWMPLYIFNDTDSYSNFIIDSSSQTANQRNYLLKGPYKNPRWLVYSSQQKPSSVRAGTLTLNETTLANLFANNGWYYNDINKVVYVRYTE